MEINKQLFEDILSGKLKGRFVMRDGETYKSEYLCRNTTGDFCSSHPYRIYAISNVVKAINYSYTQDGMFLSSGEEYDIDIVDFIIDEIDPEMYSYNEKDIQFVKHFINGYHMKENELIIEIPEGKTVDWEASQKQNKIVLKDKQLTYEDIRKKLFSKLDTYYYVNSYGNICAESSICNPYISNSNSASTAHQLECIFAKNKLANIAVYLNNGWKPSESDFGYFICRCNETFEIIKRDDYKFNNNIIFKSRESAEQAIEILGEETVKHALEPLGI